MHDGGSTHASWKLYDNCFLHFPYHSCSVFSATGTMVRIVTERGQKTIEVWSINESYLYNFCDQLISNFLTTVPRAFTAWWIIWNHIDPAAYPLPLSLCQHGDLSINDNPDWEDHLIDNQRETQLGVVVRQAWKLISPVNRELMLFCRAARQAYRENRNGFAHPKPTLNTTLDMIDCDLTGNLQHLQVRALTLISVSPETFAT